MQLQYFDVTRKRLRFLAISPTFKYNAIQITCVRVAALWVYVTKYIFC